MPTSDTTSTLIVEGLTEEELNELGSLLGVTPEFEEPPVTRDASTILSAAFILGAIKAAPALIQAVSDFLNRMRSAKYFTFRVVSADGRTTVEGVATPERIANLARRLGDAH